MTTIEQIRSDREAREAAAIALAKTLPLGLDYYAASNEVRAHGSEEVFATCASHWDACLVMLAAKGSTFSVPDGMFRIADYPFNITAFDTYEEAEQAAVDHRFNEGEDVHCWVEAAPAEAAGKFVVKYYGAGPHGVLYC